MADHFWHILLSFLPFLGILIWLVKQQSLPKLSRIGLMLLLFLVISLQSVPIHYLHATHFENLQKHDCCLPVPTVVSPTFELDIPLQREIAYYQLLNPNYRPVLEYSFETRAPPVS